MKCGVDLVFIPEFKERARRGGESFLKKIFLEGELKKTDISHPAGVFAAKEAVMKALGLSPGEWLKIKISYQKSGKPRVRVSGKEIKNSDLSISHAGDYALAVFVGNR